MQLTTDGASVRLTFELTMPWGEVQKWRTSPIEIEPLNVLNLSGDAGNGALELSGCPGFVTLS